MHVILNLWHILFAVLCGWFNERLQRVIEFQNDQIEALLGKLGKKRVPDDCTLHLSRVVSSK
ncbi:MAG: hypothetical protein ACI92S_004837 [Planctomycetaceae bacterium]|jgi:hypothetical protein